MENDTILKSDNLKSYVSRVHVVDGSFKADDGAVVNYSHLHVDFLVKGQKVTLKAKLSGKDKLLLSMADPVDSNDIL